MKHILFTVTNDLVYDQRIQRICSALSEEGYRCTLIGRQKRDSAPLQEHVFEQRRINCWFEKGKAFYLEYNLRLLFFLLFRKIDAICAIDLDTALPVYLVCRLRRKPFIFDSHEYFSELEEVITRPMVHRIWQWVEQFIMRRFDMGYTISVGYAKLFKTRYNANLEVVRNVPVLRKVAHREPSSPPYLIYQGALNIGRGLEESILAMKSIDGMTLRIYGNGPIREKLEELIRDQELKGKVTLCGALPPDELRKETARAFAGLTLFSDTGLHHQHSLANRFFDYIHAGIPQIAIDHAEYHAFNDQYSIARLIASATPEAITEAINELRTESITYEQLRSNCQLAAEENNWQKESQKLLSIYAQL